MSRFDFAGRMGLIHLDDLVSALELVSRKTAAVGQVLFASSENVALGELFGWVKPGSRLRLGFIPRALARFFPFKLKALFLDALAVDARGLRALGWAPRVAVREAVEEVSRLQAARLDPESGVPGWTVVTGAASGLGQAMAARLAACQRKLILVDRDGPALEAVLVGKTQVRRLTVDLGDPAALERLLGEEFWRGERVDELFLCAGFGVRGRVADLGGEIQANQLAVNGSARIRLVRAALPGMLARRFGRLVLVSSSSAFQPLPFMAAYAASNAAVLAFGEALSAEVAGSGVQVLTVCPGGMRTAFQKSAGVKVLPGERLAEPTAVAREILRALGRGRSTVILGMRSQAMSWLARILPRSWNLALWKRLMQGLR